MADNNTADFNRLQYKGRPLVRCGNSIYLGDMNDDYVALLQITETKPDGELDIASKVMIQLLSTDSSLRLKDRIAKRSEKTGLYEALKLASIWLERTVGTNS